MTTLGRIVQCRLLCDQKKICFFLTCCIWF